MNILSVISIIVLLFYFELGLYVFFKNFSSKLNRSFFYLCLGLVIWSLPFVFLLGQNCPLDDFTCFKISAIGWCLIPALIVRFKLYLTGVFEGENLKRLLFSLFLLPGIFFLFLTITERWILVDIEKYYISSNFTYYTGSPFTFLYWIYISAVFIFILYLLIRWRLKMNEKADKTKFLIIISTLYFSLLWILVIEIAVPLIYDRPFPLTTHLATSIYISGLAYSTLKYKLFTITPSVFAGKVVNELKRIMIFADYKANVVRVNKYTKSLIGIDSSEIYNKHFKSLFLEENLLEQRLYLALKRDMYDSLELNLKSSNGSAIPVKIFIVVIKDDFNDLLGYAVHGYDRREELMLEEEINIRKLTEHNFINTGSILEHLVMKRTRELEKSYKNLQLRIADRIKVEEQIKSDITQKEILINEIHNRVINNMNMIISLIDSQTSRKLTSKTRQKFMVLNQRIKSMLGVHENLYLSINFSDVDFAGFLDNTIDVLLKDFDNSNGGVIVKKNISDVFLNIDYAIPLGFIFNELAVNSLIHGFPKSFLKKNPSRKPTLYVNYTFDDGYYYLIVSDNGKGLPKRFKFNKLQNSGLQLVDNLVKDQIFGSWSINSDEGTFVKIVFKPEE